MIGCADGRVVHHLSDLLALRRGKNGVGLDVGEVAPGRHEARDPPAANGRPLLLGLVVGVGGDHVDRGDRVGVCELLRRAELAPIQLHRIDQRARSEVRSERERQPEHRCEAGTEQRRAEDVQRHVRTSSGNGGDTRDRRLAPEESLQFEHVFGEPIGGMGVAAHGSHRVLVAARSPPEPEIDPARVQRRERAELLGDGERRVVRQHHTTGAETDGGGVGGDVGDQHAGGGRCDRGHVVVLGVPDTLVSPSLRPLRQRHAVGKRIGRRVAASDDRQIENRQWDRAAHLLSMPARPASPTPRDERTARMAAFGSSLAARQAER